jgi:5,10-methylenetetrahydromethanopterin reductase
VIAGSGGRELGLGLQSDLPAGVYADLAGLADRAGIDVISVFGDLGFPPPLPALLEIAAATERVRIGPACLNPYSMYPHEIAGQIAALDLASGGRAFLGLTRGAWLDTVGISQDDPVTAVADTAAIVATLLRGDSHGYAGRRFRLDPGVTLRFQPHRSRVALLIGCWGPKMAALAGRIADEVKVGGTANPLMVDVIKQRVAVGAESAGRALDEIGIVVGAVTVVDEDGEAARARARREVAMYLAVVGELDPTAVVAADVLADVRRNVAAGDHEAAGQAIPDDVLDRFAFSGNPEQVAAHVNRVLAAGARRVDLGTPQGLTTARGVDLICTRVLPAIHREQTAAAVVDRAVPAR